MGIWASANLDNEKNSATQFGGSSGANGKLEDLTRKRYGDLGKGQAMPTIPPWLQAQYDQQRQWAAQSRGDQQNAFDLAQAQANGGITPQQQQLAQSYQTGNAALLGASQMAAGGARGGASARGVAQGQLGANQATQAAGMNVQQQADMLQGQALAARAADALRGADQQSLDVENQYAAQNAQNQLNWRDLNDAWRLWAATQGNKMDLAKMGMTTFGQNADFQNFLRNQQATNQAVGLGAQAAGGIASAYGAYANNPENKKPDMYSDDRVKMSKSYGKKVSKVYEKSRHDVDDGSDQAWETLRLLQNDAREGDPQFNSSDKRFKKNFDDSDKIADSFLSALRDSRATYNYTDPKYEPSTTKGSRYLGIMAQSVEKVPEIGNGIVSEVGGVKRVETLPFLSAIAGSLGRLTERVENMEKRK